MRAQLEAAGLRVAPALEDDPDDALLGKLADEVDEIAPVGDLFSIDACQDVAPAQARVEGRRTAIDPRDPRGWYRAALTHERIGDLEAAISAMEQAAPLARERAEVHWQLGWWLLDVGRDAEAEKRFRRATEIDRKAASAWNGLGAVYSIAGEHREAERAFRRTVEIDPDNLPVRANLGMAILFQGRLDEARSVFDASLAVRPDDPGAMNGMGAIAVERNDLDAAEDWFSRVLAQDPENELAGNGLAEVRRRWQSR